MKVKLDFSFGKFVTSLTRLVQSYRQPNDNRIENISKVKIAVNICFNEYQKLLKSSEKHFCPTFLLKLN